VAFSEPGGFLVYTFTGKQGNIQNLLANAILKEFASSFFQISNGKYELGDPQYIHLNGIDRLAYDVTGTFFDTPVRGQITMIVPNESQYLVGLAFADVSRNDSAWEDAGGEVFNDLLQSITFFPPEPIQTSQ
jgi:hypothetical protein